MPLHVRASRAAALLALTAVAACSDGSGSGNGRVSILLTDAPGDVRKAVVTIDRIYLQAGDGEGEDGRIVLREDDVTTDLLTLADSTAELVRDAVVPGGSYNQLRFVITGGCAATARHGLRQKHERCGRSCCCLGPCRSVPRSGRARARSATCRGVVRRAEPT